MSNGEREMRRSLRKNVSLENGFAPVYNLNCNKLLPGAHVVPRVLARRDYHIRAKNQQTKLEARPLRPRIYGGIIEP